MSARIRVLVADPHPMFREGLVRAIREARPDLELVGTASDGEEALRSIRALGPEVAVIEHDLPALSGSRLLTAVTRDGLPTRVLFLSARSDGDTVYAAIAAGAAGWLTKDAACDEIGDAVAAGHRGRTVLSPMLHAGLAKEIAVRAGEDLLPLTSRERQVLDAIASGCTVGRAADKLGMSRATAKTHLQHLYDKLGVSSQAAAVAVAMRRDLID